MFKKPTLIAGVLALVLSAASVPAVIIEDWAGEGDGNIAQTVIYPFREWEGNINQISGTDWFIGSWSSGVYYGTFIGVRSSNGSVSGEWDSATTEHEGTFEGDFEDIGGTSMFDVVSGTWTVTSGGTGSGRWWGERTDPEPDW